jgi:hypothetical protein
MNTDLSPARRIRERGEHPGPLWIYEPERLRSGGVLRGGLPARVYAGVGRCAGLGPYVNLHNSPTQLKVNWYTLKN